MKNESQYGLLLLQRYLYEHTDDQHPASVADILAFWQECGIQAGRKSVYSAIEVLQSSGMDIVCVKSTQNRYFVGERLFELPELKLLVDAVESSRFITAKKSERLIEKLGKLTSESHARQLDRHIYMEGTAKPENECIYYSVDEIHNAIQEKRQITFQYYEYTPQKEKILKHNGYRYQFSPYALIWSRDCYYAVGWSEKRGKIAQFRVDRMTAVEPLEHTAVQTLDFDPAEYVRKVFGMYPDNLCMAMHRHIYPEFCCRDGAGSAVDWTHSQIVSFSPLLTCNGNDLNALHISKKEIIGKIEQKGKSRLKLKVCVAVYTFLLYIYNSFYTRGGALKHCCIGKDE